MEIVILWIKYENCGNIKYVILIVFCLIVNMWDS